MLIVGVSANLYLAIVNTNSTDDVKKLYLNIVAQIAQMMSRNYIWTLPSKIAQMMSRNYN